MDHHNEKAMARRKKRPPEMGFPQTRYYETPLRVWGKRHTSLLLKHANALISPNKVRSWKALFYAAGMTPTPMATLHDLLGQEGRYLDAWAATVKTRNAPADHLPRPAWAAPL